MKILITGATGFVGSALVKQLQKEDYEIHVLTRNIPLAAMKLGSECQFHQLDFKGEWSDQALQEGIQFDYIVNLAGANISQGKWSDKRKKELFNSRIDTTKEVVKYCKKATRKPRLVLNASAIGYYGFSIDGQVFTESDSPGDDFLAYMCQKWEEPIEQAFKANELSEREVRLRIGVVLGKGGGAFKEMLTPFKMYVGGKLGSGKQVMSFIHLKDLVNLIQTCLREEKYSGAINAVTPYNCTNNELTQRLGKALGVPTLFSVPEFALKIIFGEMSSILLESSQVKPQALIQKDFHFQFPTVDLVVKDLVAKS